MLRRLTSLTDDISFKWLPVIENIDLNTLETGTQQENANFITFTEKILNGKLRFFCSAINNKHYHVYLRAETVAQNSILHSNNSGSKISVKRTF